MSGPGRPPELDLRIARRTFLLGSVGLLVTRATTPLAKGLIAGSMAEWMDVWMAEARERDLSGGLYIGRFKDPMYFLTKPISWSPNSDQDKTFERVEAPIGFVTDFASIPGAFWSLLRPDGNYAFAAVIHDYLYWTQQLPRDIADQIFLFAMRDLEIEPVVATTIYDAVRVFGGSAWEGNAKLKKSGEKRILSKFPDDPRMTWEEWKGTLSVFGD